MIGDGTAMKVFFVGTLNLQLHVDTDVGVQLLRVYAVGGLAINLFSLHTVQAKHAIKLDSTKVHFFGEKIILPVGQQARSYVLQGFPLRNRVNIAAVTSVPPPRPLSPSPTVEPGAVKVGYFLPPPPTVKPGTLKVDVFHPHPLLSLVQ